MLVLDRAKFPRDKICAEYLSPQASRILSDMNVLDEIERTNPGSSRRHEDPGAERPHRGRRICGQSWLSRDSGTKGSRFAGRFSMRSCCAERGRPVRASRNPYA